jgi:predicted permease
LAIASLKFLIHLAPIDVPRLADARIELRAVFFASALSLICGFLVGGVNALQVLRRSPREVLSDASRNSAGRPRTKLRSSLVVGQVALAVILMSGSGLMLRTFLNLLSADIGYRPDRVLYAVTVLPPSQYPHSADRELFFKKVLDRLRTTPGIEFAAIATGFPLVGQYDSVKVETTGLARGDRSSGISADFNEVSSGYLEAMGVRLIRGRFVSEADTANTSRVAVIDENLAKELWPGQNPLGKLINTDDPAKPVWRQVAGVVAPTRNRSLDVAARPGVFVPLSQGTGWVNFVVVKSPAAPEETAHLLKNAVASVDSNQGVFFAQSMPQLMQDSIAIRHFLFVVLMFFGGAALTLSSLGIYGLVSFIAASRVREVGIRIALGATRGSIAKLVVFQGIRLALIGAGVGLLGSMMVSRLLSGLLFGVRPFDLETLVLTIVILGTAATIAAVIPAWRSAQLQAMQALRTE